MPILYGPDLAHVQHTGFGDFATGAAPGLLRMLRQAGIERGLVVDLGCGSGILARELRRAGYEVLGVDASPALVRLARRVAPGARFRVGSAHEVPLPRCRAVTAIGEVLGYLPPEGPAPPLARLFARVARALPPGGLFVFDLFVRQGRRPMAYRTGRAGDDWAVLTDVAEDRARGRLVRDITTFRRRGGAWRRARERHVLRVPSREEVEAALRREGFSVRVLRRYGDHPLAPRRLAFRARRR